MLKNSKFALFLSPKKVGQAGNFWTLLRTWTEREIERERSHSFFLMLRMHVQIQGARGGK